jgi:hypothetical protein
VVAASPAPLLLLLSPRVALLPVALLLLLLVVLIPVTLLSGTGTACSSSNNKPGMWLLV